MRSIAGQRGYGFLPFVLMLTFYHLFFAHLLADFVLQPASMIAWKRKSWKGLAFHAFIHWILSLLMLAPYLPNPWILLLLAGVTLSHFLVDMIKIHSEKKNKRYVQLFFVDQGMHILILLFATSTLRILHPTLQHIPPLFYFNPSLFLTLIFALLITYFVEILGFQFLRQYLRSKTDGEVKRRNLSSQYIGNMNSLQLTDLPKSAKLQFHWREMLQRLGIFALLLLVFKILMTK